MTAHPSQEELRQMASRWLPASQGAHRFVIHTDTTDFFRVEYGDVVVLGDSPYLIRHNAKEGRFGVDDEVKFWVKRAIDLKSDSPKIIKLVFYEKFTSHIGGTAFECFRSPKKEARILDLVAGHKNFMHGYWIEDKAGNVVRVLDFIAGVTLHRDVENINLDHQTYFYERFPGILKNFMECIEAIRFLHEHGEKHGDIRRDHILIDRHSGRYRWIDFDFNYRHRENIYGYDLFGLGNILVFLAGKGDVLVPELKKNGHPALHALTQEDVNIVFHNRVANLKKVYPYIPESLNRVLMHFSKGTNWFYEHTTQLLDDLGEFFKP
jgi:serine/threonine protein kinase